MERWVDCIQNKEDEIRHPSTDRALRQHQSSTDGDIMLSRSLGNCTGQLWIRTTELWKAVRWMAPTFPTGTIA